MLPTYRCYAGRSAGRGHLAADGPKHHHQSPSSPSFPFDPPLRCPATFAWLVHQAETIDDPALVGPAPKPEPRDVDLCDASRSGRGADGSIELGIHRFEGWIVAPAGLHLRGPVDDDGKWRI